MKFNCLKIFYENITGGTAQKEANERQSNYIFYNERLISVIYWYGRSKGVELHKHFSTHILRSFKIYLDDNSACFSWIETFCGTRSEELAKQLTLVVHEYLDKEWQKIEDDLNQKKQLYKAIDIARGLE